MTIVITKIDPYGDIGESGWSAYGEVLPSETFSGSPDVWHGATQDSLVGLLPTCYIEKACWDGLDINTRVSVLNKVLDVVDSNWLITGTGYSRKVYYTRHFNPDSIIDGYKEETTEMPDPIPDPTPPDPCDGVVCDDTCVENDLYEQSCVDGICVRGSLVQVDSTVCGYIPPEPDPIPPEPDPTPDPIDLCDGVVCPDTCVGVDLYDSVCVDGACVPGDILWRNAPPCGYVEPAPDPEPDPCANINCGTECIGYNLHQSECHDGQCVAGALIEVNSAHCGYVAPGPDPDPDEPDEPDTMTYVYIIIGIIVAFIMLIRS